MTRGGCRRHIPWAPYLSVGNPGNPRRLTRDPIPLVSQSRSLAGFDRTMRRSLPLSAKRREGASCLARDDFFGPTGGGPVLTGLVDSVNRPCPEPPHWSSRS